MRLFCTLFAPILFLFSACAVQHHSLSSFKTWNYPLTQISDTLSFGFVDGILEKTGNHRPARWAARKNIHLIGVKLINNSTHPVHGSQLAFYSEGEKLKLLHNRWLARKVRQRVSPFMVLAVPFLLIEESLLHDEEEHDSYSPFYNPNPSYITTEVTAREQQKRKKSNSNLQQELIFFQAGNKVLYPGKAVFGIIGIKENSEITNLKVVVENRGLDLFSRLN